MEAAARKYLGEPNALLSTPGKELRFGRQGSMSIDLVKGTFFSHETGTGGGVAELIAQFAPGGNVVDILEKEFGVPKEQRQALLTLPQTPTVTGVRLYDYVDDQGEVRYQVARRTMNDGSKQFRQSRPGPDGRTVYDLKGVAPLPYNLPRILKTSGALFIVEGEKCVDALTAADLLATTNSGGAKNWKPELNQWFKGRSVVILPDNDAPGEAHARHVAEQLQGVAAEIRILRLPDLPPKGDVADWLVLGGDRKKLIELATAAEHWTPEQPVVEHPAEPSQVGVHAVTFSMTPFVWKDPASLPKREWLYGKNYIRKFTNLDVAPGGIGKSSLVMVEALAMVTGRDLLGIQPTEPLRVWYHNGEDPMDELDRRFLGACKYYKIDADQLGGRLFTDSGRDNPVTIANQVRDGAFVNEALVERIIQEIQNKGIDVLILDPFVSTHAVSENDNNAIQAVARTWGRIANITNCSISLVHHTRKTNGGDISVEDGRGGSALKDAARSARAFNQMQPSQAEQWGVDNRRLYFRTDDGKANLSPPADSATWFKMEGVSLGNGGPVDLGDSVGVVTSWTPPDQTAGLSYADLVKARAAISQGDFKLDERAPDWGGYPIGEALGVDATTPAGKKKVKAAIEMWIRSKQFVVVEETDPKTRKKKKFIRLGTTDLDE